MNRRTLALLGTVLVLGACSDDPAGPTGDRLTRAEAALIAGDVTAKGDVVTAMPQMSASGVESSTAGIPRTFSQDLNITIECPLGGQVQQVYSVDATMDLDAGNFSLDVTGTQQHMACAVRHNGVTITLDGDPDIDMEAHVGTVNHHPQAHTLEINGAFKWTASDGRSGTCPINLDAVTNFAARTRTVAGTVCGHSYNETTSWT